ncbi:MAG: hypothetical protein FWF84_07790, partial [Kiritimatiellaeota bacterium]|nr:hypothetical protein [Kiritimatiellota bacterium]
MTERRNIILIGFMGSGKSCVGRALAEASGLRFVDVDDVVVALSGHESIAAMFEREGEPFFRRLEREAAMRLSTEKGCVIACGGGLVANGDALDRLTGNDGIVVYLHCAFEEIARRITDASSRPLFTDIGTARALYDQRLARYVSAAHCTIDTDGKRIAVCVDEIRECLSQRRKERKGDNDRHGDGVSRQILAFSASLREAFPKKNAVVGSPVAHSLSPAMHVAGYRALGIGHLFDYGCEEVDTTTLAAFLVRARAEYRGLSVTMPNKIAIIPLL